MTDQEFSTLADAALADLNRRLARAADSHDFDSDFNNGTIAIEFDDPPAKFVVSPNAPVKQVWVSARVRSFKLDWHEDLQAFALPDGRTLRRLIADVVSEQLGEAVTL